MGTVNTKTACFICTTPYQVIGAVSIVQQKNIQADLYIINQFFASFDLFAEIKETKIFRNVYHVDETKYYGWFRGSKSKGKTYYGLIKTYCQLEVIVDDIMEGRRYEDIYVSSKAITGRLVFMYYAKKDISVQYHFFDDGIDSYIYPLSREGRKADLICRRLILGKKTLHFKYDLTLYSPELYKEINGDSDDLILHKLFPLKKNMKNDELLERFFFKGMGKNIPEPYLILDTVREVELNERGCELVDNIYDKIIQTVGNEHVAYKIHPREKKTNRNNIVTPVSVPLEVFCFYNDFSDKTLVTIKSTAAFTPKILYGQEPTLIFLYKIIGSNVLNLQEKMSQLVESIQRLYSDKRKVFVPDNIEDLIQYIQSKEKR